MRHLGSLLAALVVAPVAWVLLAFGQTQFVWGNGSALGSWPERALALAAAGLLLGLVATTRISPVGPLVVGVAYTGYAVAALWRRGVHDAMPDPVTIAGRTADLHAPVDTGTAIVVGVLLLVAAVSIRRWQRWPKHLGPPVTDTTADTPTDTSADTPTDIPGAAGPATPAPAGAGVGNDVWTRPGRPVEPGERVEPAMAGALIAAAAASERRPSPRHAAPEKTEETEETEETEDTGDTGDTAAEPSTVDTAEPPPSIDAGLSSPARDESTGQDSPTSMENPPPEVRPFPGLSRPVPAPEKPEDLPERAESTSPAGQRDEPEVSTPEPAPPPVAESPSEPTQPRPGSPWSAPPRQHPS